MLQMRDSTEHGSQAMDFIHSRGFAHRDIK